uniref:uncharacterized protein LOC120834050 isoform X2 n=1 Tax=Gasterosteus aculeatus aculeatus TaxID=481459 RepID=UPI001A98AD88|nr:uncharacterized protein LOC120834050 isoform X2 [Gasterosteus aculeatus aculeatus]
MEDGVTEMLSDVVQDVSHAVCRNIYGSQVLHELLSAPWLHALLKIYERLLQFERSTPTPVLPYASGLSLEILTTLQNVHGPSAEARELYSLLSSPHIQALLSSHDSVAQSDYGPVLAPLPDEMPEGEEAMRIVCLVKNNQPLNRGSVGDGVRGIRGGWSSLHRLVPGRGAWSGEELKATESEARPFSRGGKSRPFLPRYESTGSCCLRPQTAELWKKGLHQSAPSVFSPTPCTGPFLEKSNHNQGEGASTGGSSDDYAYPPPPVPVHSLSFPNSPVFYKKGTAGGRSRNVPTPGRSPSCSGMNPLIAHTAPSSPASRRSAPPTAGMRQGFQTPSHNILQGCPPSHPSTAHQQSQPARNRQEHPELTAQRSMEELRSAVQTVAASAKHGARDVRHLGQEMVAAAEMITDGVGENAQALNLLAEVVDKLQGLIVAGKHTEVRPPRTPKRGTPPPPPPRVSSMSPKDVRKLPTPYQTHLPSSSSSSSCSSSSLSAGVSSKPDGFATSKRPQRTNGGSKRTVVTFGATQREGRSGSNGQVRLSHGTVSRAPLGERRDGNGTGGLTNKTKRKKK